MTGGPADPPAGDPGASPGVAPVGAHSLSGTVFEAGTEARGRPDMVMDIIDAPVVGR